METHFSDVSKRPDESIPKISVHGVENFKRDTLNCVLDKLIMDLNEKSLVYETISKKFSLLMILQKNNQESLDLESVLDDVD